MSYYEKLVCEFENWLKFNDLSVTAQLLWYKLAYLCYKNDWNDFVISNIKLIPLLGVNAEHTLYKSRDELVKNNLIKYNKGLR